LNQAQQAIDYHDIAMKFATTREEETAISPRSDSLAYARPERMKNAGERFLAFARYDNAGHRESFGCAQDKLRERSFSIPFFKGDAKYTKG